MSKLIGLVFIMAYSSLGHLIFSSESYSFCSVLNSIQTIFIHLLGVRGIKHIQFLQNDMKSNDISTACFYGALFIAFTILWTRMLKGILTSVGKYSRKAQRSKHLVTFTELASHARRLVLSIVGRQRQKNTDSICVTGSAEDYTLEEKLKVDSVAVQSELDRGSSDVTFKTRNCLPNQQGLESASRNGCVIPNDVLSKSHNSEDTINRALDNNQCILNTENEHGLSDGNSKHCLDVGQPGCTSKYVPSDEKAVLAPVWYTHPGENAIDLEYNKTDSRTRCTSANTLSKIRRPLRRSHTTVIEPLQSSTTAFWKTSEHENKASDDTGNDKDSQKHHSHIFQQGKESTQNYMETMPPQQNLTKNAEIKNDAKTSLKTNASTIPCSAKQCW